MKKVRQLSVVAAMVALASSMSMAQFAHVGGKFGFNSTYNVYGVTAGYALGNTSSIDKVHADRLFVETDLLYGSYSDSLYGTSLSYTSIFAGAFVAYKFNLPVESLNMAYIKPRLGLGLQYASAEASNRYARASASDTSLGAAYSLNLGVDLGKSWAIEVGYGSIYDFTTGSLGILYRF